jgi:hypothetical protein
MCHRNTLCGDLTLRINATMPFAATKSVTIVASSLSFVDRIILFRCFECQNVWCGVVRKSLFSETFLSPILINLQRTENDCYIVRVHFRRFCMQRQLLLTNKRQQKKNRQQSIKRSANLKKFDEINERVAMRQRQLASNHTRHTFAFVVVGRI